jgi:hypothetical protein
MYNARASLSSHFFCSNCRLRRLENSPLPVSRPEAWAGLGPEWSQREKVPEQLLAKGHNFGLRNSRERDNRPFAGRWKTPRPENRLVPLQREEIMCTLSMGQMGVAAYVIARKVESTREVSELPVRNP